MNEDQIFEILNSYKEAIDLIISRLDEMDKMYHEADERCHKLESVLYDEILEPARMAMEEDDRSHRFAEFNDKYGERLGAFDKILSAAEGNPDLSLTKSAFDNYEQLPEPRPEQDAFVDGLIETVESQIDSIKESLGLEPDAKVDITQDENGNTTIKADDEVVASETEETTEGTAEPAEEGSEEVQGEFDFDENEEDNPEEVKKYEEELEKML